MTRNATLERQDILRPLASLLSKSRKAQRRLSPGTWQHAMLRDHLSALRTGMALVKAGDGPAGGYERDLIERALGAFASMIRRTQTAHARFSPGTAQHTLLKNRLKALRAARARTRKELDRPPSDHTPRAGSKPRRRKAKRGPIT